MALNRFVDVNIDVNNKIAKLKEPLYFYQGDKNINIYFKFINQKYQYRVNTSEWNTVINLDGASAWVTIINPLGNEISQGKDDLKSTIIKNKYIKFILTEELTDEMNEIGIYKIQFHIVDDNGAEATMPEIEFSIVPRLSGSEIVISDEENNVIITNTGEILNTKKINELNEKEQVTKDGYIVCYEDNGTYKAKIGNIDFFNINYNSETGDLKIN